MLRFLLMRILAAIPVLFVLSVVTFAIIQAPPGDYGDYIVYSMLNQARRFDDRGGRAGRSATATQYGLNEPVPVQYVNWITGIVTRGDFGHSFYYNRPVARRRRRAAAAHARCWR